MLPFVSTILITYNEEEHIKKSLNSLLHQTYPSDRREIIIVDGGSSDCTLEIVSECIAEYDKFLLDKNIPPIDSIILHNEKRILSSGWNIAIKHAIGEYVVRIDAHSYVADNFIEESVNTYKLLEDDCIVCIGGSMETISNSDLGMLIVESLSSPFGIGNSKFRYLKKPGYVDTVAYGLYKKALFDKIGYFDETLVRTQDNDLHRRAREIGGKFYLNPEIKSYYYSRNTIKKLVNQQLQNGKWTMINFMQRPGKMAIRHFIPFLFVSALTVGLLLSIFFPFFLWLVLCIVVLHLTCGLYFAAKRTSNKIHKAKMPLLFLLIHICYGTGSYLGLLYKKKKHE